MLDKIWLQIEKYSCKITRQGNSLQVVRKGGSQIASFTIWFLFTFLVSPLFYSNLTHLDYTMQISSYG